MEETSNDLMAEAPVDPMEAKIQTINEQIQKGHKDALRERIEVSKGKLEPKPQVKKK